MKKLQLSNWTNRTRYIFYIRHRTRHKIRVPANPEGDDFRIIVRGGRKKEEEGKYVSRSTLFAIRRLWNL